MEAIMNANIFKAITGALLAILLTACNKTIDSAVPVVDKTLPQYRLTEFSPVRGAPILVAEIVITGDSYDNLGGSRWFSFGSSSNASVRNLVFLDSRTLESSVLFPTNDQGLLNVTQFPLKWVASYDESSEEIEDLAPTEWFVYEVVKSDANNDGLLNRDDLFALAVSDEDGFGYVELVSGISALYGMDMIEYGKLVITYRQNDRKLVMLIDLEQKTILDIKELIDLGENVK
jgi:hypothetical protein